MLLIRINQILNTHQTIHISPYMARYGVAVRKNLEKNSLINQNHIVVLTASVPNQADLANVWLCKEFVMMTKENMLQQHRLYFGAWLTRENHFHYIEINELILFKLPHSLTGIKVTVCTPCNMGELWDAWCEYSELILGLHPANERHRYKVTASLIGCVQTSHQPWVS